MFRVTRGSRLALSSSRVHRSRRLIGGTVQRIPPVVSLSRLDNAKKWMQKRQNTTCTPLIGRFHNDDAVKLPFANAHFFALLMGWMQLAALLVGAISEFLHWLHGLMYKARLETRRFLGLS